MSTPANSEGNVTPQNHVPQDQVQAHQGYQGQVPQQGQAPQQAWGSPGYSSANPGYGYSQQPYPQQGFTPQGVPAFPQVKDPSAFASFFSTDFNAGKYASASKLVQIFALIAGISLALAGLFSFIDALTIESAVRQVYGSVYLFTGTLKAIAFIGFGLFIPAFSRVVLNHVNQHGSKDETQG